jgi:aminoglycoside phosphotransferase
VNLALPRAGLAPEAALRTIALQGGHSGADVILYTDDTDTFVRKSSGLVQGNARLMKQAVKQRLFAAQGLSFPHVRSMDFDTARRAYFDMDYVPSRTLGDLVRSQSPFETSTIVDEIADMLALFRATTRDTLPASLFHDKIAEIAKARPSPLLEHVAAKLRAMDWSEIPASTSHGDMTFENILVSPDGQVTFIDCDEPFASSWHLDFGKLFQDITGHWCLRGLDKPSIGAAERLAQIGVAFQALARELDPTLPPRLLQFAALHLFRTVPYSRSEGDVGFALRAAARLLEMTQ